MTFCESNNEKGKKTSNKHYKWSVICHVDSCLPDGFKRSATFSSSILKYELRQGVWFSNVCIIGWHFGLAPQYTVHYGLSAGIFESDACHGQEGSQNFRACKWYDICFYDFCNNTPLGGKKNLIYDFFYFLILLIFCLNVIAPVALKPYCSDKWIYNGQKIYPNPNSWKEVTSGSSPWLTAPATLVSVFHLERLLVLSDFFNTEEFPCRLGAFLPLLQLKEKRLLVKQVKWRIFLFSGVD